MKAVKLPVLILIVVFGMGCQPEAIPHTGPGQCLTCHEDERGFSPFHQANVIGCASCHQGNPVVATKEEAHEGLVLVPGNLDNASQTCGANGCHPNWVYRVNSSLMATGRGIVSVDRWVFGEIPLPEGHDGFQDLKNSPADTHLRQLCMSCHLGTPKTEPGPLTSLSRGGGCLGCHLSYPDSTNHARLTIKVTNDRCEGCHSRSGRISLNYAGWHETTLGGPEAEPGMRILDDGRVLSMQLEDVHHAAEIACIDCHTAYDVMGDGILYTHQEQATEVTCITCHEAQPDVLWSAVPPEDKRLAVLRSGTPSEGRLFARSEISGRVVTNLFMDSELGLVLQSKLGGQLREVLRPSESCTLDGHERVSCQSCHSSWVPQCLGCHTQRLDDGKWVEMIDEFLADPPVLGVRTFRNPLGSIEPFAPGMIMTLAVKPVSAHGDPSTWPGKGEFHRLYAPAVPHTTSPTGRTCVSCHLDPLALGFGRGTLELTSSGEWRFDPQFSPLQDGLPADAWIAFPNGEGKSARLDARPLDVVERSRVMRVGACLTCHPAGISTEGTIYENFQRSLEQKTLVCLDPGIAF